MASGGGGEKMRMRRREEKREGPNELELFEIRVTEWGDEASTPPLFMPQFNNTQLRRLGGWHPATAMWVQSHNIAGLLGCEAVLPPKKAEG
jgi:hypothetical protein